MIQAAQLIEDASANARDREGAECQAPRGIEVLERIHQSDRAGAHQLLEIGPRRERPG